MIEARSSTSERLETLLEQLSAPKAKSGTPVKLLLKVAGRLLLVSADEIVCGTIDEGVITAKELEGFAAEFDAFLDKEFEAGKAYHADRAE